MIVEFLSNKKKVKRLAEGLLSVTLSLIIGLSSLAIIPYVSLTAEAATQYTSGYYTYERLDSVHAKIVDVDSNISGAVTIPETLDGYTVSVIGRYAFSWLQNITSVVVPSGVTTIDNGAFSGCSKLSSVSLPENLTYIYDSAFNGCDALKNIVIPDSTIYLGSYAFAYCDSLSSVSLGAKLTRIGSYAFYNCENLAKFSVSSSNTRLKLTNGALVLDYGLICYPAAKSGTSFTVPSGITSLEPGAFSMCKNLKNVTIPNSVVRITYNVFKDCENLTTVSLPSSVKKIGYSSFSGCSSLNSIDISNVNELDTGVFSGCSSLTSITLSDKLTEIPGSLFSGCEKLKSVKIPNSVTIINKAAFSGCTSLSTISLGKNISKIRSRAFLNTGYYNNSSNCENGILYLDDYLIASNNTVDKVIVKSDCSLIADSAFYYNDKLTSIRIPNDSKDDKVGVKYIGDLAFSGCSKLTDVYLGEGIEEIGPEAFYYCNNLKSIILPKGVTTIAYGAFQGCYQLEKVHLPNTVKRIESSAFGYCDALKKVYFFGQENEWNSVSVSSYNNDMLKNAEKIYSFKKEYTEGYDKEVTRNNEYVNNYLGAAGQAMNDFCVPGITEEMVPQGLTYYPEKKWFLISAYHKNDDISNDEKNSSVIYALNEEGEFVAQFNLMRAEGAKPCRIHAGGIAVSGNNLYLTYDYEKDDTSYKSVIAYIPLSDLDVPENTLKDVWVKGSVNLGHLMNNTGTAYLNYSEEGILWTGNFYCSRAEAIIAGAESTRDKVGWDTPASDVSDSIMLGYKLSNYQDSQSEWNAFKKIVSDFGATYVINLPDKYNGIQGATIHKGVIYLSRAKWFLGKTNDWSTILAHEIQLSDNSCISLPESNWIKTYNLPGGENIFIKGDYMYSVYEASALSECGKFNWEIKSAKTDVIWQTNIKEMLKNTTLGTVNCPVDVEIYEKDTGELVGKITDNVVDSEIANKAISIPVEVDGDTKSYWLPSNKNYEVVLIGNDSGKMDYTVSLFDENAKIKERTNNFDVDLSDELSYSSEVDKNTDNLSEIALNMDDGTLIAPDQYFKNIEEAKVSISTSSNIGGTVTDSFSAYCGDKVTVMAFSEPGYIFYGWYENDILVSTSSEYSFVIKNNKTLKAEFTAFSIFEPSTTTINYGDSIILHAGIDGTLPAGTYIEWTVSNGNFIYSVSEDGTTCTLSPSASGSTVFTATIYDSEGNELATDEQEMTSKAGFFQKIIAFFKKIFGLTKVIPQAFKVAY